MGKFDKIYNNFIAGEISPRSRMRVDLEEYDRSCEHLENFISLPQGGVIKRPGTQYVSTFADLIKPVLIPFIVSKTESYIVAIRPNGVISSTAPPIQIFDIANGGAEALLLFTQTVTLATSLDHYGWHYAQAGDLLFVAHNSGTIKPFVIARTNPYGTITFEYFEYGNTNAGWILGAQIDNCMKMPFLDANIGAITLTPSAVTGVGITLTASAAFFNTRHVGARFRITHAAVAGIALVTAYTSTTVVTATVEVNFGAVTASDNWNESAWSDYQGWPRSVAIFEGRLIWGGTLLKSDTIFGSASANLFHMLAQRFPQAITDRGLLEYDTPGTVLDTDPISFSPSSQQVNSTSWMTAGGVLEIGTLGSEYIVSGGDAILSPSDVKVKEQTVTGSSPVMAIRIDNDVIFVGRDGRKLYLFRYNEENGSYITENLSVLADHMVAHGFTGAVAAAYNGIQFKQITYQQSRSIIYAITSNNELVACTLDIRRGIVSWHRHTIGGTSTKIYGLAVVPNATGTYDEVWLTVGRTINATTVYYLEKMGADFDHTNYANTSTDSNDYPWFADCAERVVLGSATATVTGLTHLIGETVDVTVDGVEHADCVVSGTGTITLSESKPIGTIVIAGLNYSSKLRIQDIEAGGDVGTSQGNTKEIHRLTFKLYNSQGGTFGTEGDSAYQSIEYSSAALFSGKKTVEFGMAASETMKVEIVHSQPYPFTLLGIVVKGNSYD